MSRKEVTKVTFGERIKELRKLIGKNQNRKYTQDLMGKDLGIGRDAVSNIEIGRVEPSEAFIKLVCATYGVNRVWLETGEQEPFPPLGKNEELKAIFSDVLSGRVSEKNAFIEAIAQLPDDVFPVLVKSWIAAAEQMKEKLKDQQE